MNISSERSFNSLFGLSNSDELPEVEMKSSYPRKSSGMNISTETILKIASALNKINSHEFNVFEMNEVLEKKTILYMSFDVFSKLNYFDTIIKENKFKNFISSLINGYDRKIPYHNDLHAADVFQTTFVIIENGNLLKSLQLKEIDIYATLLAALCHDFKHPGRNNIFQINARTNLAITYNGIIKLI